MFIFSIFVSRLTIGPFKRSTFFKDFPSYTKMLFPYSYNLLALVEAQGLCAGSIFTLILETYVFMQGLSTLGLEYSVPISGYWFLYRNRGSCTKFSNYFQEKLKSVLTMKRICKGEQNSKITSTNKIMLQPN